MENSLPERLAAQRKSHNLSQEALAEKMSLSRQAISKWERGESSPDTENLILLAKLYGVSLDELLGHSPENTADSSTEKTDDVIISSAEAVTAESPVSETDNADFVNLTDTENKAQTNFADNKVQGETDKKKIKGLKRKKKEKVPCLYPDAHKVLLKIPVIVIVPIVYIAAGMLRGMWHPYWLILFSVPLYYFICFAFGARSLKSLFSRIPVWLFTVMVFLFFGFFFSMWKYAWLVFLVNPIYYWCVFAFIGKGAKKK